MSASFPQDLFALDSPEWGEMLSAGLGAATIPVTAPGGATLTRFEVGPFRLGYVDFPIGRANYDREDMDVLMDAARRSRLDVLRFHSRMPLPRVQQTRVQDLGTQEIADLQAWDPRAFDKGRRTQNRMGRSALRIERASPADGPRINALYRGTIDRHHGNIRYVEPYFSAIASRTTLVAWHGDGICAFISFARRGKDAYYLHGGHDPAARAHYPSDQLFYTMLMQARSAGAERFDFLPSPRGQVSLLRYKQAWGGSPAPFLVSDIVLRRGRAMLFDLARRFGESIPRHVVSRYLSGGAWRHRKSQ